METVQVNIESLVRSALEQAKSSVRKLYEQAYPTDRGESALDPIAIIVLKSGEILPSIRFGWQTTPQKRKASFAVGMLGVLMDAAAIVTVIEACLFKADETKEPFKSLWNQAEGNPRKFQEIVERWRVQRYGPHIWNMPPDWLIDCVLAYGQSEQQSFGIASSYQRSSRPLQFQDSAPGIMESFLIPKWWDPSFTRDIEPLRGIFPRLITKDFPPKRMLEIYEKAIQQWLEEDR